jgi:hypothetical protein
MLPMGAGGQRVPPGHLLYQLQAGMGWNSGPLVEDTTIPSQSSLWLVYACVLS